MSRLYEMTVRVENFDTSKKEKIIQECANVWPFAIDDWWCRDGFDRTGTAGYIMSATAEGSLCGGETEDEFSERLSKVIWSANEAFCGVSVIATYMEDLPHETYDMDFEDYERIMAAGSTSSTG
jgi:hypothetical protein